MSDIQKFLIARHGKGDKYHIFAADVGSSLCGRSEQQAGSGATASEHLVYILVSPDRKQAGLPYCVACTRAFLKWYAAVGMVEVQRQEEQWAS